MDSIGSGAAPTFEPSAPIGSGVTLTAPTFDIGSGAHPTSTFDAPPSWGFPSSTNDIFHSQPIDSSCNNNLWCRPSSCHSVCEASTVWRHTSGSSTPEQKKAIRYRQIGCFLFLLFVNGAFIIFTVLACTTDMFN